MDIVRTTKKSSMKRFYWLILLFLSLVLVWFFYKSVESNGFQVNRGNLMIATVKQGDFTVKVRGTGVLKPKEYRWISSDVAGRVEKILVKPGAKVKSGDVIIELTNLELKRKFEETKWDFEAKESESRAALVSLESVLLEQKLNVFNAKFNLETVAIRLKAEEELFSNKVGIISKIDHEKTKLQHSQAIEILKLEKQREVKVGENIAAHKNALSANLNKMRKNLENLQEQINNLRVKATMDSVIQETAIEIGQQVVLGSNLVKLAQQKELVAELQIPELSIRDVTLEQPVYIDTRNNKIKGKVIRIAPSVSHGTVQVDVSLKEPLPNDARPDLSVDGEILVASFKDTLYVRRPSFVQSHRIAKLFKLNSTGNRADKTVVSFGRGSVQNIQIIDGLSAGDKIILSQNEEIQRFDNIVLN